MLLCQLRYVGYRQCFYIHIFIHTYIYTEKQTQFFLLQYNISYPIPAQIHKLIKSIGVSGMLSFSLQEWRESGGTAAAAAAEKTRETETRNKRRREEVDNTKFAILIRNLRFFFFLSGENLPCSAHPPCWPLSRRDICVPVLFSKPPWPTASPFAKGASKPKAAHQPSCSMPVGVSTDCQLENYPNLAELKLWEIIS